MRYERGWMGLMAMDGADERPLLVCLHFLGGSALVWKPVEALLGGAFRVVGVDLPGFGDAAGVAGYDVAAMAEHVAGVVRQARGAGRRWQLVGHSMGAKVAAVMARRAEDGEAGLEGLERVVLLAGSPPGKEPMKASKRREMLGWFQGDTASRRVEAEGYVDENQAGLPDGLRALAVGEVERLAQPAWAAWLEGGSTEDWADRVGVLRTKAVIVSGGEDEALGAAAQRKLMAPHFADCLLVSLPGAKHLLPLERPEAVARLILDGIPAGYRALIESGRVSAGTRAVLLERAAVDDPGHEPQALDAGGLAVLRAVVELVLPQEGAAIDLGARIDTMLATGPGDGWRPATLPPDAEAYRLGVRTLDALAGGAFAAAEAGVQEAVLVRVDAGEGGADGLLDGAQMKLWFEEVRAEVAKQYVAHPRTLARLGYGGIGIGGEDPATWGFATIGAGERDGWEPVAAGAGA